MPLLTDSFSIEICLCKYGGKRHKNIQHSVKTYGVYGLMVLEYKTD